MNKFHFFGFFGDGLVIKQFDDYSTILWYRMNFIEIILCFICLISGIWGIGVLSGKENIIGLQTIPLSIGAIFIFWLCWLLMMFHLFFNRKSHIKIDINKLVFSKRPFSLHKKMFNANAISKVDLVLQNDYFESDSGRSSEVYDVVLRFSNGTSYCIDGFSKIKADKIKAEIESWFTHLKLDKK